MEPMGQGTATMTEQERHLKELESYKETAANKTVPVMEIFGPTIQGEGAMVGVKTLFVRFGGCDYRCAKCDSLHAIIPELVKKNANWVLQHDLADIIIAKAKETNTRWVTLSGGNPTMWDLDLLVRLLITAGIKIAVETQGSIWRDWLSLVDQLTISPKGPGMGETFDERTFREFMTKIRNRHLSGYELQWCVKIVVFGQDDFEFAVGIDELLNEWTSRDDNRYLSLGNDHPPSLHPDGTINTDALVAIHTSGYKFNTLHEYLLWKYKMLLEEYFQDPRLSAWKFLPQLHVLVWDNKAGV